MQMKLDALASEKNESEEAPVSLPLHLRGYNCTAAAAAALHHQTKASQSTSDYSRCHCLLLFWAYEVVFVVVVVVHLCSSLDFAGRRLCCLSKQMTNSHIKLTPARSANLLLTFGPGQAGITSGPANKCNRLQGVRDCCCCCEIVVLPICEQFA